MQPWGHCFANREVGGNHTHSSFLLDCGLIHNLSVEFIKEILQLRGKVSGWPLLMNIARGAGAIKAHTTLGASPVNGMGAGSPLEQGKKKI